MPETPSVDFFDKYKDSSEMAEPSQKRQHMEVEQQQEEEEEQVFEQDDEEGGRFFGGGLTSEQHDILDLVDQYDAEEVVMTTQNSKYIQTYSHSSNRQ